MSLSPESGYLLVSRDKQSCLYQDKCITVWFCHCKRSGLPAFTRVCQALKDVLAGGGSHTQCPPSLDVHIPVSVFLPGKGVSLTPSREEG